MLRVTYGVASASHLAVKSMQQTAKQSSNTFQKAVNVIIKDFYMDDLLTGASSKSELKALQRNVSDILREGGFELRKWASNCTELNEAIARESKNISHYTVDGNNVHALGLIWYMEEDYFTFSISLGEPPRVLTKRAFLVEASKLFDPLSLLSPATIRSKMLFQDIWRSNTGWDDPVPDTIGKMWLDHRSQLQLLSELKVNRWVGVGTIGSFTELHVFADASERAYAAVIYARTVHRNGDVKTGLISAKTKVAPLKTTTLPRLELCAAHLAAKLVRAVMQSWEDFRCPLVAWTDSTITLAWLQAHPNKWETFVANRVAYIHEVLPPECWNHVRSESNPADCASRGISPLQLKHHELWWFGPDFLREDEHFWKQPAQIMHKTEIGLRKVKACIAATDVHWSVLTKYSSYSKLKRIIAYVLRFIHNIRSSSLGIINKKPWFPNCQELLESERRLIKYVQNLYLSTEIRCCREKRPIKLRSSLLRLQPFLDSFGILRVGGRLKTADVANDVRHPIILPKNSPLSKLVVLDIHHYTLHAGPRIMQVILQRRYWVVGARNLIRNIYRKRVKCTALNRKLATQSMGALPSSRITYARYFTRTAVDFAGPYMFKFTHRRGAKSVKGYISSFVSMRTGAMHLEFVGDLLSSSFLNAFKRFINRRGYCKEMFSDNGTNFVGAERELREKYQY